jgi:hypothetical protein
MQSVIKPLNDKVKTLNVNLAEVLRGLRRGDPEAKKAVSALITSVKNTKSEFTSTVNSMYASYESSVATMAGLYNPMPMVKIIAFFLQEVLAAIQLLTSLLQLIANLLSVSALLTLLSEDIAAAQGWLNKKMLWLTKSLNRVKEITQKKMEWKKRDYSATYNLAYYKEQKQIVENTLTSLKAKLLNAQQDITAPPDPNVNGEYVNGVFIYFKTSDVKRQEAIIVAVQGKLDEINANIEQNELELSTYIPNDQAFYRAKWDKEVEQDKKDLITDVPKLNADVVI